MPIDENGDITSTVDFCYSLEQDRGYNSPREKVVYVVIALARNTVWFGCSSSISVEVVLPAPAHFPGVLQAHLWVNLLGLRMDLTGHGLYDFPAIAFTLSAFGYYVTKRLMGGKPNHRPVSLLAMFLVCDVFSFLGRVPIIPPLPLLFAQCFLYACEQCARGSEIPQFGDLG